MRFWALSLSFFYVLTQVPSWATKARGRAKGPTFVSVSNVSVWQTWDSYREFAQMRDDFSRATRRIDIIIYDHRYEESVGNSIVAALSAACERGVRVRVISPWINQVVTDPLWLGPKALRKARCGKRLEVRRFGGPRAINQGLTIKDNIHEKVILVDDEISITTGRGFSSVYHNYIDSATWFRSKSLNQQLSQWFVHLWDRYESFSEPVLEDGSIRNPGLPESLIDSIPNWRFESTSKSETDTLLAPEPFLGPVGSRLEWRNVGSVQLVWHSFLSQVEAAAKQGNDLSTWSRETHVHDEVLRSAIEQIDHAKKSVRLSSYAFIGLDSFKRALAKAVQRGVRVTLFTNGEDSANLVTPLYLMWASMTDDLLDVARLGVKVFTLKMTPGFQYLHLKLLVIDDRVVLTGSHNLNSPSTLFNDELSFWIDSPEFAMESSRRFDRVLQDFAEEQGMDQLIAFERKYRVLRPLGDTFMAFY